MSAKRKIPISRKTVTSENGHPRTVFEMECISTPKDIGKVEDFLKEVNKAARLDDGTFHRLFVSSTEAVNNAILHGNKSDPSKKVCIGCMINRDSITVSVKDEGAGFDPQNLPNPLDEQNLLKESGRGIFLIKSMTDRVDFQITETGTTIQMMINLKRLR